MNFAGALIQWGQATGNTAVRDAGIYLYTTQAEAIADYWFDVDGDTSPKDTSVYFAGWDRARYQWKRPVKVAVTGDVSYFFNNALSLACDKSNRSPAGF